MFCCVLLIAWQLLESVATALRAGGNVLIPTDTAGRVLEMAMLLDQWFQSIRPQRIGSLAFLSDQSYNVMTGASSLLEWMSERLSKAGMVSSRLWF